MRNKVFCLLFLFVSICSCKIKMFQPNLISDNQSFGIAMSPSGEDVLYVKAYGGRDTLQIFQSRKLNGKWQEPELAFFSNPDNKEIDPSYGPEGKAILYNSLIKEENGYDVYIIRKTSLGWAEPERLSESVNTSAHEFYATMSKNKNIYFTRRGESNDIYVSYWVDGKYQKALPLEGNINTTDSESNPYISSNEDFIIFTSRRKDSYGNADLYISFNKKNKWSYPINLGKDINTSVSEFCPSVDIKNQRFFFSRTIIDKDNRIENIYSVPIKKLKIEKLKKLAKWNS